ncbi:MAG TPA: hypothetical protein VE028_04135 [Nitratidesulfovibrio sp.]|nr:hypothetical protein [Nitratidesulfovibrio sp.]
MSDLPKCRLCGNPPCEESDSDYVFCDTYGCAIYWKDFEPHEWAALMAPPVVTDATIDRVVEAWENCGVLSRATIRAVLEAALKE